MKQDLTDHASTEQEPTDLVPTEPESTAETLFSNSVAVSVRKFSTQQIANNTAVHIDLSSLKDFYSKVFNIILLQLAKEITITTDEPRVAWGKKEHNHLTADNLELFIKVGETGMLQVFKSVSNLYPTDLLKWCHPKEVTIILSKYSNAISNQALFKLAKNKLIMLQECNQMLPTTLCQLGSLQLSTLVYYASHALVQDDP
ncbi:hypothetical protein HK100_006271, partial [Physocladia obscura]